MDESRIGYVVGEADPTEFWFSVDRERHPQRWDYVVVNSKEFVDGEDRDVQVLAQIETVVS